MVRKGRKRRALKKSPSKPKKRRSFRFKLLLDEMIPRQSRLTNLNKGFYDIKHVGNVMPGARDPKVFEKAKEEERIIVTSDARGFKPHFDKSKETGIIIVDPGLRETEIDKKLVSLLRKSTKKQIYGKVRRIKG